MSATDSAQLNREDALERGRSAYAARAWADAHAALACADAVAALDIPDLERLVWAASLAGRDEEMVAAIERLHQTLLEQQQLAAAARYAFWAGFRLFALNELGRASAWMTRAQRLADQLTSECAEHGYLLLPAAIQKAAQGDFVAAYQVAGQALDIGERCRDRDLVAFARVMQGRNLVRTGKLNDGLRLMDESMLAASSGELSPVITGLVYCSVLAGCNQAFALDRAREWTRALERFCQDQPQLVPFSGSCLVQRAELLQQCGAWQQAVDEARRATSPLYCSVERPAAAEGHYQQGEVHRLRGEAEQAEAAYREAHQLGREPQPGFALLRLQQGRTDAAAQAIRRMVSAAQQPLVRARYLPAFCEIMLAAGALDEAERGSRELDQIAADSGSEVLVAMAAYVRGAWLLARAAPQPALEALRTALGVWLRLTLPYIEARTRELLARACAELGDQDGAALELDAAQRGFTQLGAAPDLARLRTPAAAPAAASRNEHNLSPRELEVLRLVAAGKTNRVIARELGLSEKTVDRHVSNILTKIDVSSRAAATAYAYEHGLV